MVLPSGGTWVLGSEADRNLGDETEFYDWLVEVKVEKGSTSNVMLANDNLAGSRGGGSVLNDVYRTSPVTANEGRKLYGGIDDFIVKPKQEDAEAEQKKIAATEKARQEAEAAERADEEAERTRLATAERDRIDAQAAGQKALQTEIQKTSHDWSKNLKYAPSRNTQNWQSPGCRKTKGLSSRLKSSRQTKAHAFRNRIGRKRW